MATWVPFGSEWLEIRGLTVIGESFTISLCRFSFGSSPAHLRARVSERNSPPSSVLSFPLRPFHELFRAASGMLRECISHLPRIPRTVGYCEEIFVWTNTTGLVTLIATRLYISLSIFSFLSFSPLLFNPPLS